MLLVLGIADPIATNDTAEGRSQTVVLSLLLQQMIKCVKMLS
jgi:hypothetical protein